jgi:cytochrome b pre-mRNA-processing protein 3
LSPLTPLFSWRHKDLGAQKLYGAIVAQARLPVFYQAFGVPDTLEGRFVVLSLNLFAVLHRLKADGGEAHALAQELIDQFSADMETVLREIGVGDISIPKKVRRLAASAPACFKAMRRPSLAGMAGSLPRLLKPCCSIVRLRRLQASGSRIM